MATPPGPSFIPKQNPVKVARRSATKQVYLLTLISYILIIAALVAVAGVFLYDRYTKNVLAREIEGLSQAIASFNPDDMDTVIELDERLISANDKLAASVSVRAVLAILEKATIDTVQFSDLELTRESNGDLTAKAEINTDSFDSVLFQRGIYEAAADIASIKVSDVEMNFQSAEQPVVMPGSQEAKVNFSATFSINDDKVPYVPSSAGTSSTPFGNGSMTTPTAPPSPVATSTAPVTSGPPIPTPSFNQ